MEPRAEYSGLLGDSVKVLRRSLMAVELPAEYMEEVRCYGI